MQAKLDRAQEKKRALVLETPAVEAAWNMYKCACSRVFAHATAGGEISSTFHQVRTQGQLE